MAFYPYLNFDGTCREAFTRYQEIFGGELGVMTFDEMPDVGEVPAGNAKRIAHATLNLDNGDVLMASDTWESDSARAHGVYVNVSVGSVDEADRIFAALADGGEVEMPIGETFWSPRFGVCRDRFGIPWMVNADVPAS